MLELIKKVVAGYVCKTFAIMKGRPIPAWKIE